MIIMEFVKNQQRKNDREAIRRGYDDRGLSPEAHRQFRASAGLDYPELDQALAAFGDQYGKKIVMHRAQAIYNASPEGIAEAQALKAAQRRAELAEHDRLSEIQRSAKFERARRHLSGGPI